MERRELIVIDSDVYRRASIAHALTNMASFVIPLEHYSELTQCWPKDAVLLIEDAGSTVESLCRLMKLHQKDLPFVAFSADASPARRSAALIKGAGAYLPWPCSPEELKSTLLSVATKHIMHPLDAPTSDGASGFPQFTPPRPETPEEPGLRHMRDLWRASAEETPNPASYAE